MVARATVRQRTHTPRLDAEMAFLFLTVLGTLFVLSGVLPYVFRRQGVTVYYAGVLPVGIAVLFMLIQLSPSPASSIEQIIECVFSLLVICLSISVSISLLAAHPPFRRSLIHGQGMWFVLGGVSGIYLLFGLTGNHVDFPLSQTSVEILQQSTSIPFHFEIVAGCVLASLALLGFALRLGPMLACAILGIFVTKLFLMMFVGTSGLSWEIAVGYPLAVQQDFSVLLAGIIGGAAFGLMLDVQRARGLRKIGTAFQRATSARQEMR